MAQNDLVEHNTPRRVTNLVSILVKRVHIHPSENCIIQILGPFGTTTSSKSIEIYSKSCLTKL